ncbi:MAG: UbiA family prenyltransferase [Candidatus Erginobacter occultus]|nr:UbiA family prenyltransferase [Candidatus Erginobacter occultus]
MKFLTFIRWREWGPDKLPFLFTFFFYAALADRIPASRFLPEFLSGAVFLSALAVFGYLANDLGDREIDRAGGKANSLSGLGPRAPVLVFAGVFAVMLAAGLAFAGRAWFVPLWAAQLLAAAAYSLPPLRLKARGVWGLAANVAAQFILPVLLVFAALGHRGWLGMSVLAAAATLRGTATEFGHQLFHLPADREAGVGTLAVRLGEESSRRLYRFVLLLDRLAVGGIVAALLAGLPPVAVAGLGKVHPALGLVPVYLWLLLRARGLNDPYYFSGRRPAANLLQAVFPQLVVPFYLSLVLALRGGWNVLLPVIFLAWIVPGLTRDKIRQIAGAAR